MPCPSVEPHRGERGIALVIVLWTLVIVVALSFAFTAGGRADLQLAATAIDQVRLRALLRGAFEQAVYDLARPDTAGRRLGTRQLRIGEHLVTLRIQRESGRVDLNRASPALIEGLALRVGLAHGDAAAIARRLVAWREGADARPLRTPDELAAIPDIPAAAVAALMPYVTVWSASDGIDPQSAPAAVLNALPGATPGAVAALLRQREAVPPPGAEALAALLPGAEAVLDLAPAAIFHITADTAMPRGGTLQLQAVVWVDADNQAPFRILDWREEIP
jgi:general secretion pathway protein K